MPAKVITRNQLNQCCQMQPSYRDFLKHTLPPLFPLGAAEVASDTSSLPITSTCAASSEQNLPPFSIVKSIAN